MDIWEAYRQRFAAWDKNDFMPAAVLLDFFAEVVSQTPPPAMPTINAVINGLGQMAQQGVDRAALWPVYAAVKRALDAHQQRVG